MAPFGMTGIGRVYEHYRDGKLVDDDEVAVMFSADGEPSSEAFVDIRATVERAVDLGVLVKETAREINATAKAMFYPDRSLHAVLAKVGARPNVEAFAAFVEGWLDKSCDHDLCWRYRPTGGWLTSRLLCELRSRWNRRPWVCCDSVNVACPTSCTSDAACAPTHFCAPDGSCNAPRANGSTFEPHARRPSDGEVRDAWRAWGVSAKRLLSRR